MTAETEPEPEPRWPAAVALFGAAVLPLALPRSLTLAPTWFLVPTNVVLLTGAILAHKHNRIKLTDTFSYANLGLLTLSMLYSLATLVLGLMHHIESAPRLLQSAAILWVANVIVGAAWYWRLDAGGPRARDGRRAHMDGAFLFAQMAVDAPGRKGVSLAEAEGWRPGFIDYLAISFYTCTAFSPTDVQALTRWAKLMMMLQAGMAFGTVILLTARAVNIL
ncbi:MAG TPA: hypothetical protein VN860_06955 [Candidatus Acidoferrales bacterium]|nr:hypothetical protein [Candidatus Acidoferrales bacterium]